MKGWKNLKPKKEEKRMRLSLISVAAVAALAVGPALVAADNSPPVAAKFTGYYSIENDCACPVGPAALDQMKIDQVLGASAPATYIDFAAGNANGPPENETMGLAILGDDYTTRKGLTAQEVSAIAAHSRPRLQLSAGYTAIYAGSQNGTVNDLRRQEQAPAIAARPIRV